MIAHLIGFPGAGKYTVAREMARISASRGERLVVVDNHHTTNVIFAVLDIDGMRLLPPTVWDRVGEVREAVLRAIEELSPPEWSFVFTNVLIAGQPKDEADVARLQRLARARGHAYFPVHVLCDTDELARRVVGRDRRERLKWVDPDGVRAYVEGKELFDPGHGDTFVLDITAMPPGLAASVILDAGRNRR